jgi:ATP-grasp domain
MPAERHGAAAHVLRTAGVEALLLAALPFSAALTGAALLRARIGAGSHPKPADSKTILVSGGKMTKALALARAFHRDGHRVVLVESRKYRLTGHRFSNAVDRWYAVPEPTDPDYTDALLRIVKDETVDVYVPVCSPVASHFDALAKTALSERCEVIHLGPDEIGRVDDKYQFSVAAAELGLSVPETHLITDASQVARFDFGSRPGTRWILKSIPYDPIRRLDLTKLPLPSVEETAAFAARLPISPQTPWILQEFVEGQEYCTHATVRHGNLQVHCCCRSSPWQINYEHVDKPEIEAWVRRFVGALGLTGQVSLDFIEAADGRIYAIECNPRTHSAITMFYNHPDLARAYLEDGVGPIEPLPTSKPTHWTYHELWRALSDPVRAAGPLRTIWRGKDAIFDWADPLPFLVEHHVQIPWLLVDSLRRRSPWVRIDFNIGKLVEPAGD